MTLNLNVMEVAVLLDLLAYVEKTLHTTVDEEALIERLTKEMNADA